MFINRYNLLLAELRISTSANSYLIFFVQNSKCNLGTGMGPSQSYQSFSLDDILADSNRCKLMP